jgi:hypothetical protein
MKTRILIFIAAGGLVLAACIPSVHPFYNDKDVVFEPRLAGQWQEKEKKDPPQVWKFEAGPDKSYKLNVTEEHGHTCSG